MFIYIYVKDKHVSYETNACVYYFFNTILFIYINISLWSMVQIV